MLSLLLCANFILDLALPVLSAVSPVPVYGDLSGNVSMQFSIDLAVPPVDPVNIHWHFTEDATEVFCHDPNICFFSDGRYMYE